MIRIKADKDGRLTQWDKNRTVIITGLDSIDGVKVHFSSPTDNHDAYVVEPLETDGVVTAEIPDELLTIAGTIWVYVYPDSYTKSSAVLSVMRREKPDDYTYGGGGAPQVQADWGQNDESAVDFIKNRPGGYMGDPHEGYILNMTEYAFATTYGDAGIEVLDEIIPLSEGAEYTVEWDGTPYRLTATKLESDSAEAAFIGNAAIVQMGADTGEPFCVLSVEDLVTQIATSVAAKHTVAISTLIAPVIPIDSKFLPQSVFDYNALNNRPVTAEPLDITMSKQLNSYTLTAGSSYIAHVNETLEVEGAAFYRISGTISLTYQNDLTTAELILDGLYPSTSTSDGEYIELDEVGEFPGDRNHSPWSFKASRLYSASSRLYDGALCVSYNISRLSALFDIKINLKIEKKITQLDTDYIPAEIARKADIPNIPVATSSNSGEALVVGTDGTLKWSSDVIIPSSTADSTKKFRITVDDTGTLSATEVTE